jgi:hypothetical protein
LTTGRKSAPLAAIAGVVRKQTMAATQAAQTPTRLPNDVPQIFVCIPTPTNEPTIAMTGAAVYRHAKRPAISET